jgi:hypothetical protein
MNRSILIVICDFLLVSLLAFSTVDINKVADSGATRAVTTEIATNQVDSGKDLAAVMRLALDEERVRRDALLSELNRTRETTARQQNLLMEREQAVQHFQNELQGREQAAQALQQQQANLERQLASAKSNLEGLNQQLQSNSAQAAVSQQRAAAMEAEARKRAEEATALQQQIAELQETNQTILAERQRLAGQLQVAEVEKRAAAEQAARMQDEVKLEREEKARLAQQAEKLADGVKSLANQSGELAEEIREHRALAPNTIFSEFVTNRVAATFSAFRSRAFGIESTRQRETQTVLVTDGTNTFAVCHVEDTPLVLGAVGIDWDGLTGTFSHGAGSVPIRHLSFAQADPRVVLMPLSAGDVQALRVKVYPLSADPFKFQDAVLVGAREGYYGECKFQIDLTAPDYVRLDRSFIRGLFGKFNPSRGDLVFSKTGELLGVMANSSYCFMLHRFEAGATVQFGPDIRAQHTGAILSRLYAYVFDLPVKLH